MHCNVCLEKIQAHHHYGVVDGQPYHSRCGARIDELKITPSDTFPRSETESFLTQES